MAGCGLVSCGTEYGLVAGSRVHSDKSLVSVK
jgi:hypothetical protein